jgi:hypothetical protein
MTDLRYPDAAATSPTHTTRIPRQRIGTTDDERLRLQRAATTVEQWLDTQLAGQDGEFDEDEFDANSEHLLRVSRLAIEGVPEAELAAAVGRAREAGWNYAPIAMLLCTTPEQVQVRFATLT